MSLIDDNSMKRACVWIDDNSMKRACVWIDVGRGTLYESNKTISIVSAIDAIDPADKLIITGLESIDSHTPNDYLNKIITHLKTIRNRFKNAALCVIIENTLGMEADWIKREIGVSGITNYVIVSNGNIISENDVVNKMMTLLKLCARR